MPAGPVANVSAAGRNSYCSPKEAPTVATLTDDDLRFCFGQIETLQALGRAAAVAWRWRALSRERAIWRRLLDRKFPGLAATVTCADERALLKSLTLAKEPRQPTLPDDVVLILEMRVRGGGSGRSGTTPRRAPVELVRTYDLASLKKVELAVEYDHNRPQCEYQLPLTESDFTTLKKATVDRVRPMHMYGSHSVSLTLLRKRDLKTVHLECFIMSMGVRVAWEADLLPLDAPGSWGRRLFTQQEDVVGHSVEASIELGFPGRSTRPNLGLYQLDEDFSGFGPHSLYLKVALRYSDQPWPLIVDPEDGSVSINAHDTRLIELDEHLLSELQWS